MKAGRLVKLIWYLELLPKLGPGNVLYVFFYRIRLKSGYFVKRNPVERCAAGGAVFLESDPADDFPPAWKKPLLEQADRILAGSLPYFSFHWMPQANPPDWFLNPFTGKVLEEPGRHWSLIPDFSGELGDIKGVWEASRFSWLGILARAHVVSGNPAYLGTLNEWLDDWIKKNPLNQGPHWKCGQETSFRLLALLNAAMILGQAEKPSEKLVELLGLHLKKISSNIHYAFAQRNNHATSEAAALYVGGNWLLSVKAPDRKRNQGYARAGRRALEKLLKRLTYADGSFSQHSIVYHRLLLDTLNTVLYWNACLQLPPFSESFYERVTRVYDWLYALLDESGDAPNLGPNDGTMLLNNHSCDYRDFRPSLQLASFQLKKRPAFREGPYNEVLYWMGFKNIEEVVEPGSKISRVFPSGYVVMQGADSWAMLRFPNFKFRPSHNDALHFDLWARGDNLLFDAGSYSYNPPPESEVPDLKSVHAHNTLSFDGREQMPRLGRFLMAKWLKPLKVGEIRGEKGTLQQAGRWEGAYRDAAGNTHERGLRWSKNSWEIRDRFSGRAHQVELGFNFQECEYTLDRQENRLTLPWGSLRVSGPAQLSVRASKSSRYYFQATACYRLLITAKNNNAIKTTIEIN
jgi:hypothetical protein